jgi:hypothetical protein
MSNVFGFGAPPMSFFVSEFDFNGVPDYAAVVAGPQGGFYLVGGFGGGGGLLASVTGDGAPAWQKVYTIAGQSIRFRSGVRCDNGDMMLHGSMAVPIFGSGSNVQELSQSLVIRVSSEGAVLWANLYLGVPTRYNIRLVKGPNDTYFFASAVGNAGSNGVEVVSIDGAGNVRASVYIDSGGDARLGSIIADGAGCIVFGGTSSAQGRYGFAVALDGSLGTIWKTLVGANNLQQIAQMARTGPRSLVILGETAPATPGTAAQTFIGTLPALPVTNGIVALVYDFQDDGSKHLLVDSAGIYVAGTIAQTHTSFAAQFNADLRLVWQKALALPVASSLTDIQEVFDGAHGLVVCGASGEGGLVAYTDAAFDSCVTKDLTPRAMGRVAFDVVPWSAKVTSVTMTVNAQKVQVQAVNAARREICASGLGVDLETNPRFQSRYLYLQAAGSDFSDQTVRGFDLRWDLLRGLGDAHLPKGNLAAPGGPWPATIGYNRADDFVRICRTELRNDYGVDVKFGTPPSSLFESGHFREWLYEDLSPYPGQLTDLSIRFADVAQYDALRAAHDPHVNPQDLITSYTGVIEVRAVGKLAFLASIQLLNAVATTAQRLRVEALTLPDPLDNTSRTLSCRRTFTAATNAPVVCENIESIRFDYSGVIPVSLHIATYEDFLRASSARKEWKKLGDYSLDDGNSDADAGVFRRLEDPAAMPIDGIWPKFQRVPSPGVFRVRAQSYRDRWRMPADGLKPAVTTYLDASRTDVKASVVVANSDPVQNTSAMELSYLDLLNFVSLDYHVARMLGLGAIDPSPAVAAATQFLYLMQYVTDAQLEHETPVRVTHYYMTPPVRITDYKEPPVPVIHLGYGLPPENCGGTTTALTDPNGYAAYADARFVNLNRDHFRYERPLESFFQTTDEFCLCEETVPVAFGVRYGPGAIGAGNEVQPELSNNPDWLDPAGIPEVSLIPERGENPVYTHEERNAGVHHYALYSINWFSRTAGVSAEVQTDATTFARRNTLLPPSNFAVQLIQKEDPLIFTSADEQTRLGQLPAGDHTLVRGTFDWNYVQNDAYQSADTVELYFRALPPVTTRGEIVSVMENSVAHTATVVTTSYLIDSTNPQQTVQPEIAAGDVSRFAGARLSANGQSWIVYSVQSSGLNPTLVLRQNRDTASIDIDNDRAFCTVESWLSPSPGWRFLLAENLNDPAGWETKLAKEISLASFLPIYTETVTHNDGQSRTLHLGGLSDAATVDVIPDPDPGIHAFVPAGGPPVVPSGAYTVRFSTRQLPASTDPDVDYHEGIIRMPDVNGGVKVLRVWNIGLSHPALELTVFDSTFGLQRDASGNFLLQPNNDFTLADGYVPIQAGPVPNVNFHPSYRVYLTADHAYAEPAILPARDERTRQTYMTVRARDSSESPALTSPMAKPAVLLALELQEPVAPGPPLGPLFATRPNFFGKSTYTFDVQVDEPYSLIFYKANDRKILDQLYKPDTVRGIVAQLDNLSVWDQRFTSQRWSDLVHVVTGADDQFIEHALNGFQFPIPDNPDYVIPDARINPPVIVKPFDGVTPPGSSTLVPGTTRTMKDVVQEAVNGAFVPLTETPLVYRQLDDKDLQTSGRPPKLRDTNGKRLVPGDPRYDPWPMAVRYEKNASGDVLQAGHTGYGDPANTRWVRFADYTIDGASKNLYFYFAVELANTLKVSVRSPVAGPVQLVNASPPEAPVIRKITAQLNNGFDVTTTRVNFELSGYLPSEGVASYKLYRALAPDDALSVRTMTELPELAVDAADFYDDFTDLGYVPFAQPIYYRAVAFRHIVNEFGQDELIPSKASDTAMTTVADTVNPPPPQIAMTSAPLTATHPFQYSNVSLSWPQTTYNGRYHLYKLNNLGTWVRVTTVQSNAPLIQVALQDTSLASDVLVKEDAAGNTLYHRFRVMVENSSGLVNLDQNELTV